MLVASTAVGLFSPIAAQASETINLEGMNSYRRKDSKSQRFDNKTFTNDVSEELATLKGRIDGLQAQQNNFEAGSFSDTTTLDGKAVFTVGSFDTDDGANDDDLDDDLYGKLKGMYSYTMNLNTSFTGDDNLYVRIKTGNASGGAVQKGEANTYVSAAKGSSDALKVDKIWYKHQLAKTTHFGLDLRLKTTTCMQQHLQSISLF